MRKISHRRNTAALWAAGVVLMLSNLCSAQLTFYVDPNSPWPSGWYSAAVANMQTVVNEYNAYESYNPKSWMMP